MATKKRFELFVFEEPFRRDFLSSSCSVSFDAAACDVILAMHLVCLRIFLLRRRRHDETLSGRVRGETLAKTPLLSRTTPISTNAEYGTKRRGRRCVLEKIRTSSIIAKEAVKGSFHSREQCVCRSSVLSLHIDGCDVSEYHQSPTTSYYDSTPSHLEGTWFPWTGSLSAQRLVSDRRRSVTISRVLPVGPEALDVRALCSSY